MSRVVHALRTRQESLRAQDGFSLLEVLIAMALISILVVALINGLLTSTQTDNATNENQHMNAALNSFGETLKDVTYKGCADAAWYQGVYNDTLASIPDPEDRRRMYGVAAMSDVEVTKVEYFTGASFPVDASGNQDRTGGSYVDTCSADTGTQLLTFKVRYRGRSRTAQTVKRDSKGVSVENFVAPEEPEIPGNTPPSANFTITPGAAGSYTFTSTSADSGTNAGLSAWNWNFGDATAPGAGETVSHTFGPGIYTVTLTVTDLSGATAKRSRTVGPIAGKPATITDFRLVRTRYTGLSSTAYDFTWTKIPGVQRYRITARWCVEIFGTHCTSPNTYDFGDVGAGTIYPSTPPVGIGYFLRITVQGQIGAQWGDPSNEVRP